MSYDAKKFISSLSKEQHVAALKTDEPVMIIACAGSGKTRTLVARFLHLVLPKEQGGLGADPSSVMMVTFTNKAAREMRERIAPVLEDIRTQNPSVRGGDPWIGTFHGLSLRILRVEAQHAGLGKNFSILDESDARSVAMDVVEELNIESFDVDVFFRDLEKVKARMIAPDILARREEELKTHSASGKDLHPMLRPWFKVLSQIETPGFTRIYTGYQASLAEQNAVDFSDLMNHTTQMFRDNPKIRDSWRSTFRHFMVDEVQDINRAQIGWLKLLTNGGEETPIPDGSSDNAYADASHGLHEINTFRLRQRPRASIAFVGDDDQAIYGFRGSDASVMQSLDRHFPGLDTCFLTTSYRCQPSVLSLANTLVANNTTRFEKQIRPADETRKSTAVTMTRYSSPQDEITSIADAAKSHMDAGHNPGEFAVLVRTRALVKAVAKGLRETGLPVYEGKASDIRKSAEVRDAMAFVGFMVNSDAEVLLRRIINKPSRGLGPSSLTKVTRNARLKETTFLQELRSVMNNRIEVPEGGEGYPKRFVDAARDFGRMIVMLRGEMDKAENAAEAIEMILDRTGYLDFMKKSALKSIGVSTLPEVMTLSPKAFITWIVDQSQDQKGNEDLDHEEMIDRASRTSEMARRIGNISLLLEQARPSAHLEEFMQEATLEMETQEVGAGVRVMTVHASKGLEFDRVFLPFWIDGVIPHSNAQSVEEIEEERRLAYVALTRSKESVDISYPYSVAGCGFIRARFARSSQFISDFEQAPDHDFCHKTVYQTGYVKILSGAGSRGSKPAPKPATKPQTPERRAPSVQGSGILSGMSSQPSADMKTNPRETSSEPSI